VIGYYAHHHGDGHLARATAIAAHLDRPVTLLSSRPAPAAWSGASVLLARDDEPAPGPLADATAQGVLHWAPLHHAGLRERMGQLAAWIAAQRPRLLVADVSVEVALLARLTGTPVVVVAPPGRRDDPPHRLAYTTARAVLAPWPAWAQPLQGPDVPVRCVGAFSRFDGRPTAARPPGGRRVLVLGGRGGTAVTGEDLEAARRATPGWSWAALGPPAGRWVDDPWPLLCGADVVVTHAGANALAEVAASRRPAVVIPQPRPHDEQQHAAAALDAAGLAVVAAQWPASAQWPALLERATAIGGMRWARWAPGDGARRAAALLEELAA
jgi:hypothetical protein